MIQYLVAMASSVVLLGCDMATSREPAEAAPMIKSIPERAPQMTTSVAVPDSRRDEFLRSLSSFGTSQRFAIEIDQMPGGAQPTFSGMTRINMTRGTDRITAVDPFRRDEFFLTVAGLEGDNSNDVRQLAQALAMYLNERGFNDLGSWEPHFMN